MFSFQNMGWFIAISFAIHFLWGVMSGYVAHAPVVSPAMPISVTLLEQPKEPAEKPIMAGKLKDAPDNLKESKTKAESKNLSGKNLSGKVGGGDGSKKKSKHMKKAAPLPELKKGMNGKRSRFAKKKMASISPKKKVAVKKTEERLELASLDEYINANPRAVYETESEAVVPLNSKKFEYADYFSGIRKQVEGNWNYPEEAIYSGISGGTLLRVTIARSGRLEAIKIVRSSGSDVLDAASVNAVKSAMPFKPFPDGIDKLRLHIVAYFDYGQSFRPVKVQQ